jgi:hypothetical protein
MFNLPPGTTSRMIDEAAGVECPCDMCGHSVDDCVCPECKCCGTLGDPACYRDHGLVQTEAQVTGRAWADLHQRLDNAYWTDYDDDFQDEYTRTGP